MDGTRQDPGRRAALIGGAAAAGVVFAIPFLRFVFGYLAVLIHELGHTVVDWVFGRPSIPAFDFVHGGGVTIADPRKPALVALIAAVLAFAAFRVRDRPRLAGAVVVLTVVWAGLIATGVDRALGLAAGHLAVLSLSAVFLHRAESGTALRTAAERPAYAFAGTLLWLGELAFAWRLATSHEARVEYELAKGGGAWMDLSRLADGFLGVPLANVAAGYLAIALALPAAGLLARRAGPRIVRCVLWLAEPGGRHRARA